MIYDLAIGAGATIQFGATVVTVDPMAPSVTLANGEILEADLIIGSDGYRSLCRQVVEEGNGEASVGVPSGTIVYSYVFSTLFLYHSVDSFVVSTPMYPI